MTVNLKNCIVITSGATHFVDEDGSEHSFTISELTPKENTSARLRLGAGWNSVEKDGLPKKAGRYICRWKGKENPNGITDVLNFDGEKFPWEYVLTTQNNKVTHWMPEPEPPKEVDDNG